MSASAEVSGARPALGGGSRDVRPYFWLVSAAWFGLLAWGLATKGQELATEWSRLLPWIVLLAFVNLLPLDGWHAHMAPDFPIGAAAAMVLSPIEAGVIGFVSAFDSKEFKGQIALSRAIFNRSQLGIVYYVGSLVPHQTHFVSATIVIVPVALLTLAVMCVINYLLVGAGITIEYGYPLSGVLYRLRLGTTVDLAIGFAASALLAAMLAALHDLAGTWALVAIVGPTLLGRQALKRSQMFLEANRAHKSRELAVRGMSLHASEERSDERRLIAADLHDEVLQPLFKVTLMAHVLKADLATGRLLEMDEDIPELISAAEDASNVLRELIGDLRRSAIGMGGLPSALRRLSATGLHRLGPDIHVQADEVVADPMTELSLYQVAKEAVGNALAHGRAANIWIDLHETQASLTLTIQDDGIGFDPLEDRRAHFGIAIMRERALAIGGELFLDSMPGKGARVSVTLRKDPIQTKRPPEGGATHQGGHPNQDQP
jgi:signal transduction histidine kinase